MLRGPSLDKMDRLLRYVYTQAPFVSKGPQRKRNPARGAGLAGFKRGGRSRTARPAESSAATLQIEGTTSFGDDADACRDEG